MKKSYIVMVFVLCGLLSVRAQSKSERKQQRKEKKATAYAETKALLDSGAFVFIGNWANPLGGQQISLINNYNELKLDEGVIKAFLPYFGTTHRLTRYGSTRGGIVFEMPVEGSDYAVTVNDKKQRIRISFSVESDSEFFNVALTVFPERRTLITVTSSNRTSINYTGKIKALPKEG